MYTEHQAVLISELHRFVIVYSHENETRVTDLAAALFDGDHPPVTFLLVPNEGGQLAALPWNFSSSSAELATPETSRAEAAPAPDLTSAALSSPLGSALAGEVAALATGEDCW